MACKHEGGTDPCIKNPDRSCPVQRRAYGAANRAKRKEYSQAWRAARIERDLAYKKAHYKAHREEYAARNKAWREANQAKIAAYREAYRERDRELAKVRFEANKCEHGRTKCGICRPKLAITTYKAGALKRGYSWELTDNQAVWLMQQPCTYCGVAVAGGIDRAKNEYGYTVLNSVPCCATCNMTKRVLTVKAFIVAVNAVSRYCPDYPKFKRRWERIRKKLTQLGEQQDADVSVSLYRVPRNHGTSDDVRGVPETPVVYVRGAVGSDTGMSSVVS
jgi:hypothetical protein